MPNTIRPSISKALLLCNLLLLVLAPSLTRAQSEWAVTGQYEFSDWAGPKLKVFYSIPPQMDADSQIVVVIPGAKRNADQYRDEWDHLAVANQFITLVVEAAIKSFPTEFEYNLGGVIDSSGNQRPENEWLFTAIDPLFDDFKNRFGSNRKTYNLYGHSAGGGFVHRFLLFKPDAKVNKAVAANPAFATLPDYEKDFPFGLRGVNLPENAVENWLEKSLVLLLGDRDRDPRTHPLSNSFAAQQQGPHVLARGMQLYQSALLAAGSQHSGLVWQLEVVPRVGHSNAHMASYAVKHLLHE
ncbi:alpha/beta hydrolase [Bythopirellula polymerisocia]|uniref:Alpha/beta hydrolase family protein n=1 Tax=Bythopirellula polymerisocia TaxID=2528003 RepID=A0A5C6CM80_9BACT|nr:alpha/beta hydrolase [Bythopirellula polymerisocia]TWU26033.1 hypothetical protein Pla144_32500 [Bythopirellula polymerisocia]